MWLGRGERVFLLLWLWVMGISVWFPLFPMAAITAPDLRKLIWMLLPPTWVPLCLPFSDCILASSHSIPKSQLPTCSYPLLGSVCASEWLFVLSLSCWCSSGFELPLSHNAPHLFFLCAILHAPVPSSHQVSSNSVSCFTRFRVFFCYYFIWFFHCSQLWRRKQLLLIEVA